MSNSSKYKDFIEPELKKFYKIQDGFISDFNINSYANWFYDSESELLRLYNNDEDEIFFKYIRIGTFSPNENTWMWSWFNESIIGNSKLKTLKIKEFGIQNNYEKLTNGTFSSDQYDGFEFLAISQNILNGIGSYVVVDSSGLRIYFLLLNIVNQSSDNEIKKLKQKTVNCGNHGFRREAFVCQHLNSEANKGFVEAFETYKDMELDDGESFQAWCNKCEKIRLKSGGWNDDSEKFAKIKLICEECYFEYKRASQNKILWLKSFFQK